MSAAASVSTVHRLTINDIRTVLEELTKVSSKWNQLGIWLELPVNKLECLLQQNGPDCQANLCAVLIEWLKSGDATWECLCEALQSETLGEKALAETLKSGYCAQDLSEGVYICILEDTQDSTATPDTSDAKVANKKQNSTGTKRVVKKVPQRFSKTDFVQAQKSDRFCSRCKQVPHTPKRSSCCRSLYCDFCSPKITVCVKCKGNPLPFKKDQELFSKIQKVRIYCPNRTRDCMWKGEVYKLKKHFESAGGCEATKIGNEAFKGTDVGRRRKTIRFTPSKAKSSSEKQSEKQKTTKNTPAAKSVAKMPPRKRGSTHSVPPLNLVMEGVCNYIVSGEMWLSNSFYSHQLGYKVSLAVKLEPGSEHNNIRVTVALASSDAKQSSYLDYPCIGYAAVFMLNSECNDSREEHEPVELMFLLEKTPPISYPDVSEQTEIPSNFVHKDCLFFRVDMVEMIESDYKLWLLDTKYFKH